ncbi:MAG: hypothetical protein ACW991_10685 [Candidatus Hodarchaeales archaeon]
MVPLEVTEVVNLNAVQLLLPKLESPRKNLDIKKLCSIKRIDFKIKEDMINSPINQVLKTILELMNEIPVEEEVSWEKIHQIQRNYANLHNK